MVWGGVGVGVGVGVGEGVGVAVDVGEVERWVERQWEEVWWV